MKTFAAILAACVSVLISTAAGAIQTVPIAVTALTGADLVVKRSDGSVVAKMRTDDHGQVTIKGLVSGDYLVEIDGSSLVTAIDRLAPPTTKKSSGPSVSVGGFLGGSSHSSRDHEGAGERSSSHSTSSGIGLGLSVPLGVHGDDPQSSGYPTTSIAIRLPAGITGTDMVPAYQFFTINTPYCRDSAGQGMRVGFRVLGGTREATITISLQPANTTLNE